MPRRGDIEWDDSRFSNKGQDIKLKKAFFEF